MRTKFSLKSTTLILTLLIVSVRMQAQCTFSGLLPNYCTNSPNSALTTTITGGTFSGPGMVGTAFSPSVAGPGTHTISFGICTATYVVVPTTFSPGPTSGSAVYLTDDSESGSLPIGFTFNYYCTPYTNFYISSNGYIEFTLTGNGCCNGQSLPNFTNPSNLIAFCWADLNPGNGGTISYSTIGLAPTRTLVVSFTSIPFFSGSGVVTSQIKLFETSNIIEVHTTSVPVNTSYNKTNGIENAGGTIATVVAGRNASASWTATNSAYRWEPGTSCTVTQTTIVSPSTISVVGNASICAGSTTTLTATGNTTYTWNTASNSSSIVISPTISTIYGVNATNAFGCVANAAITVTVDNTPTISAVSSNTTGGACPNSTVILTGSGATTYTWTSPVVNGIPFAPSSTGTYVVTGQNACGTASAMTSVSIHPFPTVSGIASSPSICSGNPVSLTGVGNAVTYTWTGGIVNGLNFFPTTTGNYTVTGISAQSCSNTSVNTITVVTTPQAQPFASPPLICIGNSSTLTAAGATTYTWTTPGGVLNTTSIVVAPLVTTIYTVSKANANCVNTQTVALIVNQLPNIFTIATPTLICANKPATLTAAGAATYTWQAVGPPSFSAIGANPIVSPGVSTMYTVTASDGTCINTGTLFLAVNPNPTIVASPSNSNICRGESATLTASGGLSYTWTTPGGTVNAVSTVQSPTSTTLFSVIGINNFNCISGTNQVIIVNPTPTLNVYSNKPLVCIGAPASLTVSGANTYQWDANANNATTPITQVNPLVTTVYSVTGFYSLTGCNTTKTIQVNVFSPTFAVNNPTSSCLGGTINLIATGAISYTWNGSQPFQIISVSPPTATVYVVAATSQSNGLSCISTNTVGVSIYLNPTVTAVADPTLICKGEIGNLIGSGASTYMWNTSQAGSVVPVSPAGQTNYTVTGTDQNGCIGTASVVLKVSTCFGINEQAAIHLGLSMYPNPNNGTFMIKSAVDLTLELVNELGQLIKVIQLVSAGGYQQQVTDLANGVYFVTGEKDGIKIHEKIVITN